MPFQKDGKRDYKRELEWEHKSKPNRVKERSARNTNRREMEKDGRVKKGDGKHVDHKKELTNGGGNSKKNLRVVSAKTNLTKEAKRKQRESK